MWQPWASAIAAGLKRIETRDWFTHYRGPLLIHAATRGPKSQVADWIDALDLKFDVDDLPFGAIIAVTNLTGCCRTEFMDVSPQEELLGDYSPGRFGWLLDSIRAFDKPIPYRGRQRLFNVPYSVVADAIGDNP
ncbi:MAG: ASCH domain-containing protein [Phycisphaeraceae bacterium]|nr:ASCH domain-containing protein [Phycisphaeraceae bacterium]